MEQKELQKEVGARIKKHRKDAGFNQHEVALHLGITEVSVSNMEVGKNASSLENMYKMAELFDCDIIDFMPDNRISDDELIGTITELVKESSCPGQEVAGLVMELVTRYKKLKGK